MNHFRSTVQRAVFALVTFLPAWLFAIVGATIAGIVAAVQAAGAQAMVPVAGTGPFPASMTSAQAPQAAQVIHYNNNFTKNLAPKTPAQRVCNRRPMPENAGQKYQDYVYPLFGTYTTQATEGQPGTGLQITPLYTQFTLGQWANYVNFSDFVISTSIDPIVENVEAELAKSLGRTVQRITLVQFDALRTYDASVAANDATSPTQGQTRNLWTSAAGSMRGRNIQPLPGMPGYGALIHPFHSTDILVDSSSNSVTQILMHTVEGQMKLAELPANAEGEVQAFRFSGITFLETTELTTSSPTWAAGKTAIRSYLVGNEAMLAVSIGKRDRTDIGDGDWRNLKLWRGKYGMGQQADPAGQVGGACSYNVVGTWGPPADPTARARCFDFVPQTT